MTPVTKAHACADNPPSGMDKQAFVALFGGVYERSPWLAEAVWDLQPGPELGRGRDTAAAIHDAFKSVLERAGNEAKLALLRAHPDLAGKLAVGNALTAESTAEQAGAGLGDCSPEEFTAFQDLNRRYQEKFGFPFILAVRGYRRGEILDIFRRRLENDPETEFEAALEQVHRIALLRLEEIP